VTRGQLGQGSRAEAAAITEVARAKVNLTLEVVGRRPDKYHELASLVAFAGVGDRIALTPAASCELICAGPTALNVSGENIALRALMTVRARWPGSITGAAELHKELPVAAGIGGGSADAAAILRILERLNPGIASDRDWQLLACDLGADVPVCRVNRLSYMRGLGDRVDPINLDIELPAVLVNPNTPLSTARVFADLAAEPVKPTDVIHALPQFTSQAQLLDWVHSGRNDLEPPALRLAPIVGRVRAALQAERGCQLARLTGSGPTCFGLFGSQPEAANAAAAITREHPEWWVRPTNLG
jgi:4-diphosphocytidyl-2-C-methyl-D-erythritol kinase